MLSVRILFLIATTTATDFLKPIQSGVYKETLGPVQLIANNAEVWTKIELGGIETELIELKTLAEKMDERCRRSVLPNVACDNFRNLSLNIEANIEEKHDRMTQERSRRGLINVFGSIAKFLFGTMDAEDSEKLDDKMKLLFDENWKTKNFKIKYTEIVEKTVSRLNLTADVVNHNSHALETLEKHLAVLSEREGANREAFIIMDLKNSYLTLSQALSNKIDGIHQMLIDLHNNVLNTHFVSYSDLIKALKNIKMDDPAFTWPFDLDKKNFEVLRKLLKFSVFSSDSTLLIVFTFPLVEAQRFNFQRFYPVPFIKDNFGTFIDVNTDLIVADDKLERFTTLSEMEKSSNCLKADKRWFCSKLNLMQTDRDSCLGAIMAENNEKLENLCKTKILKLKKTLLVKTEHENTFLAFSGMPVTGKIFFKDSKESLLLNGTQLLSVNRQATLKIDDFEVRFYPDNRKVELEIIVSTKWSIELTNVDLDTTKLAESYQKVLLSQDFSELGTDLASLKQSLDDDFIKSSNEKKNTIAHLTILIISITLTLVTVIYIFNKYKFFFTILCKCCKKIKIEEIEMQEIPLSRRARGRATT